MNDFTVDILDIFSPIISQSFLGAADFLFELSRHQEGEAYRSAVRKLFGSSTPAVLDKIGSGTMINAKSVVNGLQKILSREAVLAFEMLALNQVPMGKRDSWSHVVNTLGPSYHSIHFCRPFEEDRLMLEYLDQSLRLNDDVKVVSLWHVHRTESMAKALLDRGHAKAVKNGRLTFLPQEKLRNMALKDGTVARPSKIFAKTLDTTFDKEGYSQMRFGGSMAGSLFRRGEADLTKAWEDFLDTKVHEVPLTIYCPYPVIGEKYDYQSYRKVVGEHNWAVIGNDAYPLALAN